MSLRNVSVPLTGHLNEIVRDYAQQDGVTAHTVRVSMILPNRVRGENNFNGYLAITDTCT
jgi:hypothetical protein